MSYILQLPQHIQKLRVNSSSSVFPYFQFYIIVINIQEYWKKTLKKIHT